MRGKAQTRSTVGSAKYRGRPDRFGDLRLLGLSVGLTLLCILGIVFSPTTLTEHSVDTTVDTQVAAPLEPVAAPVGDALIETNSYGHYTQPRKDMDIEAPPLGHRTPEERDRLLREMGENMPEGEVLIW